MNTIRPVLGNRSNTPALKIPFQEEAFAREDPRPRFFPRATTGRHFSMQPPWTFSWAPVHSLPPSQTTRTHVEDIPHVHRGQVVLLRPVFQGPVEGVVQFQVAGQGPSCLPLLLAPPFPLPLRGLPPPPLPSVFLFFWKPKTNRARNQKVAESQWVPRKPQGAPLVSHQLSRSY